MISSALSIGAVFVLQHVTKLVGNRIAEYTPSSPFYNTQQSISTMNELSIVIGYLVVIYVIIVLTEITLQSILITISQKVGREIRNQLFVKIQNLPVKFFDANPNGELMSRFTNDVNNITNALSQNIAQIMKNFFMVVGMLIGMFIESSYLTLISLALLPILFGVMGMFVRRSQPLFRQQQDLIGKLNGFAEEMISGQIVINLFNNQKKVNRELTAIADELADVGYRGHRLSAISFPWAIFCTNFIIFFSVFMGILLYVNTNHAGFGGIGK